MGLLLIAYTGGFVRFVRFAEEQSVQFAVERYWPPSPPSGMLAIVLVAARGFIGRSLKVNLLLFATVEIVSGRIDGAGEAVITILNSLFHTLEYLLKQNGCKRQAIFSKIGIVTTVLNCSFICCIKALGEKTGGFGALGVFLFAKMFHVEHNHRV